MYFYYEFWIFFKILLKFIHFFIIFKLLTEISKYLRFDYILFIDFLFYYLLVRAYFLYSIDYLKYIMIYFVAYV